MQAETQMPQISVCQDLRITVILNKATLRENNVNIALCYMFD